MCLSQIFLYQLRLQNPNTFSSPEFQSEPLSSVRPSLCMSRTRRVSHRHFSLLRLRLVCNGYRCISSDYGFSLSHQLMFSWCSWPLVSSHNAYRPSPPSPSLIVESLWNFSSCLSYTCSNCTSSPEQNIHFATGIGFHTICITLLRIVARERTVLTYLLFFFQWCGFCLTFVISQ